MEFLKALIAKAVGAFLVLGLTFTLGYLYRDSSATKEALQNQLTAFQQADKARQDMQGELNAISDRYVAQQADVDHDSTDLVARLRADGIRLRVQLADATVASVTGGSRCEPDGYAELSDRSSQFLIGQARKADQQVTALQQVIHVLQEENHSTQ